MFIDKQFSMGTVQNLQWIEIPKVLGPITQFIFINTLLLSGWLIGDKVYLQ